MAGDWSTSRLADVAVGIQTGPFGSQLHASDYIPSGVPVVMPTNIRDRRIDIKGISFIGNDDADRLSRHKLQLNDLIFSRRGEVDKCALVTEDIVGWLCGTGCLLVRPDEKKCDPAFLSFHISAPDTREWLKQHAVGLVMPNLNTKILSSIPLNLPPISEQRRIAVLLGSLDDKIELNRRMAATLEDMAGALFKSWFVNFDPVRAKAEGRDPGLPAATAALFPDSFGEDGLPVGWEMQSLAGIADVINGAAFSSTLFNTAGVGLPLIRIRDLKDQSPDVWTEEGHPAARVINPGDLVVGMDGEFRCYVWSAPAALLNQRVCTFVPKDGFSHPFVRYAIEPLLAQAEASASGTTVIHLGKKDIDRFRVIKAKHSVVSAYSQMAADWHRRVVALAMEVRAIAELRDTLLPKLISGELRTKDVGKDAEAA